MLGLHPPAGPLQVSLEVEEEAHPPPAKEAPKDAPALEVKWHLGRLPESGPNVSVFFVAPERQANVCADRRSRQLAKKLIPRSKEGAMLGIFATTEPPRQHMEGLSRLRCAPLRAGD